jgi:hypothetical protein
VFITLLGGAAATWPFAAPAQQGERRQITVWISRANDAEGQRLGSTFRAALQALGWINGRNARIDYRWVTSEIDRPSLAAEIVEHRAGLFPFVRCKQVSRQPLDGMQQAQIERSTTISADAG